MDRFATQPSAQNIVGSGLWSLRLWHRDPDVKNFGSNPLNSLESATYGLLICFDPAKILILNNLTAKSWIDWT
jgi:hypothetical protein